MMIKCRNCNKIFYAKNTLFCSISCYKVYENAIERNNILSSEDSVNQIETIDNSVFLWYDQKTCNHEFSKNGTISCRKCGHTSLLTK
jgi:DNA-directed RNA polymerase subunit M/transcription elongation factor TFIIS